MHLSRALTRELDFEILMHPAWQPSRTAYKGRLRPRCRSSEEFFTGQHLPTSFDVMRRAAPLRSGYTLVRDKRNKVTSVCSASLPRPFSSCSVLMHFSMQVCIETQVELQVTRVQA